MPSFRKSFTHLFLFILLSMGDGLYANTDEPTTAISRYARLATGPTIAQHDLLSAIVEQEFTKDITRVGDALRKLLATQGMTLETPTEAYPYQAVLYLLPLPETHRTLGPMAVGQALELLGGDGFKIALNPITRTVGYRLDPDFQHFIEAGLALTAVEQWTKNTPTPDDESRSTPELQSYGPVHPGETLSRLVSNLLPPGVTLDQGLVAVFQRNPHAFVSDNMNRLSVGVTLFLPAGDTWTTLGPAEATHFVEQHYRTWLENMEKATNLEAKTR